MRKIVVPYFVLLLSIVLVVLVPAVAGAGANVVSAESSESNPILFVWLIVTLGTATLIAIWHSSFDE